MLNKLLTKFITFYLKVFKITAYLDLLSEHATLLCFLNNFYPNLSTGFDLKKVF